jgi:hypothetical protein
MATFTFITDYKGGTYISQQEAADLPAACYRWKDHVISGGYIQDLNAKQFGIVFDADIHELPPVAIDDTINVWLFQLLIEDNMLITHIILTDLSTSQAKAPPNQATYLHN